MTSRAFGIGSKTRWTMGLLGLVCWIGAGCEATNGSGSDGGVDDGTVSDGAVADSLQLPEGVVSFHAADESAEVQFDQGDEQFVVVAYSVAQQVTSEIPFTVKVQGTVGDTGTGKRGLSQWRPTPGSRDPDSLKRLRRQMAVEKWTRGLARRALGKRLVGSGYRLIAGEDCDLSSRCGATEVCHEGKCSASVTIRVAEFSDAEPIEVQVKAKGTHVAILADSAIADGLSADDLEAIKQTFDDKIYPRDVALFGNPPLKDGEPELSSDRNGDGLLWIVLTERVADKLEAVGFFVPTDFAERTGDDPEPNSNEADILYALPPGSGETTLVGLHRIMAHELQHVLSFAVKVRRAQANGGEGALEALWLDEGQSHFAEDACGFGRENVDLLSNVLDDFSDISMIPGTDDDGNMIDSEGMRALSLMFVRYLFEQKGGVTYESDGAITDQGGAAWLASMHLSSTQGRALIEETYGDFVQAFDRWIATVGLDNRGVTDSPLLNYGARVTDPQEPKNDIGLRIRGEFEGTDPDTPVELNGPLEEEISSGDTEGVVASTSAKYYMVKGLQGTATVTVSASEGDVRFAVIKVK